ncbi:MAG TPA: hypothetical protein VGV17_02890 [Bosea sp. (in: a-proteobacteria)]|jgi:chemotaxis regulatin CheY-phosphate phosphatase CheZ|uniref:P-loop ATPase, Sll1717 family n=1 Tax=Bosea sp. (in: a-proteobacteria) TaxID=1871050 RepID=UPI002DDCA8EF|nr:hypothetical protein [Bosea sp. (in: a-proteobacteria)]HEV2552692.1 hypothetical protein [Bosea sp. (in: a-proteobacteria)]
MPTFNENFGFRESPFDQYVAEREPRIDEYAVKPPYFEETRRRVASNSSYLLFGFRGSGKSATRITAEKEIWKLLSEGKAAPLMVSLTDYDAILKNKKVDDVTFDDIIKRVAFLTVEAILLWISNQEEKERILEILEPAELRNLTVLSKAYYLNEPEADRLISQQEAMRILHQNWSNRTLDWINRKWGSISSLVGVLTSALAKSKFDTPDISKEVSKLLQRDQSGQSSKAIISRLVDAAKCFGFTGICVLVDKVDEHPKTQRSTEETAKLIHPIVSQVQLMEIADFAWIFFLWDKVKTHLSNEKLFARLDKFAHSEVSWPKEFLEAMIKNRLSYFSDRKIAEISEMCEPNIDSTQHLNNMIALVQNSPRELVRLLDVVTREFNSNYGHLKEPQKLVDADFDAGQDIYVRDVLWTIYENRILSQLLRFNTSPFTNRDVQQAFKISSPGARGRIQSWEACGAVSLTGTRAPEGESGGKPASEYSITDPRILRMAERKLYDPEKLTEAPIEEEDG